MTSTPVAARSYTDCFYFINSHCTKGAGCEYRHSPEAKNTTTVCKKFSQGQCTNVQCPLRHLLQTPCAYFSTTGCNRGDSCPYAHIGAPSPAPQAATVSAEEDKLKALREQVRKEQEALEELKKVGENLTKKTTTETNKKAVTQAPNQNTFTKTLSTVLQQDKKNTPPTKNAVAPAPKKSEPAKVKKVEKKGEKKEPAVVDFGIKPLSVLLAEKNASGPSVTTQPPAVKATVATQVAEVAPVKTTAPVKAAKAAIKEAIKSAGTKVSTPPAKVNQTPAKNTTPPVKKPLTLEEIREKNRAKFQTTVPTASPSTSTPAPAPTPTPARAPVSTPTPTQKTAAPVKKTTPAPASNASSSPSLKRKEPEVSQAAPIEEKTKKNKVEEEEDDLDLDAEVDNLESVELSAADEAEIEALLAE
ncbi:ribosome-binding protein 1-like [Planoprotostelium fungivorum]|uniref:Ribosome-binding protein 1-like n=1 Tax=Planoprotostelium fungivorum TaxID=1890364 RepID=A0A2P6MU35_9EUKA|nr:ribosome-binding protein 1-like [Planoprotostelium fungivorum]